MVSHGRQLARGTPTDKQSTSNDIPQQRGNDPLPDVQRYRDLGRPQPDRQGDEGHIGDDVVKAQRHEGKGREPDAYHLGGEIAALDAEEASQTDQPVAADPAEENLMEVRGELFLRGKGDDLGFLGVGSKDVAILSKLSDRLKKKKKSQGKDEYAYSQR